MPRAIPLEEGRSNLQEAVQLVLEATRAQTLCLETTTLRGVTLGALGFVRVRKYWVWRNLQQIVEIKSSALLNVKTNCSRLNLLCAKFDGLF